MPTMPPGPDFDQQLHAEQVENARLADLWRDVSGEVHRLRGGDRPDDQPVDDQEVMYAVLTALRTPAPTPVRPIRHEAVVQVNVKDVDRTVRQVMDRDAAAAQRWRAVRDEVLRLDQIARPSTTGVVMADDDVEPLVLDVLRTSAARNRQVDALMAVPEPDLRGAAQDLIDGWADVSPSGHVDAPTCRTHGDPDPSGVCDWAYGQAERLRIIEAVTTKDPADLADGRAMLQKMVNDAVVEKLAPAPDRHTSSLHFVCTATPGPSNECAFVELEDDAGRSVSVGEWRHREDGLVELLVPQMSLDLRHIEPLKAGSIVVLTLATDTPQYMVNLASRLLKELTDPAGAHGVVLHGVSQDFTVLPNGDPKLRHYHALIRVLDAAADVCGTFAGSDRCRPSHENLTRLVSEAQAALAKE